MEGLRQYLDQEYKNAKYSEIKYAYIDTAPFIINIDFSRENAIAILTHYIYWDANQADPYTFFFDQFSNPIFQQLNPIPIPQTPPVPNSFFYGTQWAPIPLIRSGTNMKITGVGVTSFSVSYQYLVLNKDKDHKHE